MDTNIYAIERNQNTKEGGLQVYKGLKGRYTFGNCQRPVSSLGVSHHKHKITSL